MRRLGGGTLHTLLAVVVAIDVVLVGAVVRHMDGKSASFQAAAADVFSSLDQTTTAPSSHTATPREPYRLLSFSSADDGWRATAGCGGPARLQRTTDGGRTWERLTAPAAHVLRLTLTSATAGWLVGADSACTPTFFSTSDAGTTWTAGTGLGQAWVVLRHRLRLPTGTVVRPCKGGVAVDAVTPASVNAALTLCGSRLIRTTDGGATWAFVGPFVHGGQVVAMALVPGSSGRGVAMLIDAEGCSGLAVVRTTDVGAHWSSGPCFSQLRPPVAVSLAPDGSGYAFAQHGSIRTTDAGANWT